MRTPMALNTIDPLPPRSRKVKIFATLGPASSDAKTIRRLLIAGADAFRINMSHGDQKQKAELVSHIRALEKEFHRPSTILFDLQGPKLRVGHFPGGGVVLVKGKKFVFDRDPTPGDANRVELPHPELFEAVKNGTNILIDDGKIRLIVIEANDARITAEVKVGGRVSDNKGVNVPDILVPIPALTEKDRSDLQFALEQKADWVALSFVQRPEDVAEARSLIGERASLLAKIEKPAAIDRLDDIVALADAVMVARGDLGVELPPEAVPPLQNRIVACARQYGKPVVAATQMLESMITSLIPARRLGLLWGTHAVHTRDGASFEEMVEKGKRMALRHKLAHGGERVVLMAGIPFGTAGSTNVLHVARLIGDELERHAATKNSTT